VGKTIEKFKAITGLWKILSGKKTNIGSTLIVILGLLFKLGYIDADIYQSIIDVLMIWTGGALAHKIKKAVIKNK
jgi:hypothetical protein